MKNHNFKFKNNLLFVENISVNSIVEKLETPLYIYSKKAMKEAWDSYYQAIKNRNCLICYGMKANSNLAVLKEFSKLGSGFDIVSGGELERVLAIKADPKKIVFSGVGKQSWEIEKAIKAGIKCFNVESEAELQNISKIAKKVGIVAPISLRVNPDVDANTHPYISTGLKENKFGVSINTAYDCYQTAIKLPNLEIVGIDCHIGSQLTEIKPFIDSLEKIILLINKINASGIQIKHIDIGGGIGIQYKEESCISPKELVDKVFDKLEDNNLGHLQVILEPGRSLIGNAGILVTKIQYLKESEDRNFAIVDAAMNDIIRPALYHSYHEIVTVVERDGIKKEYDVVGPICESSDWLAKNRYLNELQEGELLAIESVGAYCMTMASNYNTRGRAAEVMVDESDYYIIKRRETIDDLLRLESTIS
ncbi:diaminopimelate decarboxylase [Candidatus Kinetoplastibacterium oncopeltii TCC290E]|uniref:Diaminopimelate decarboxylase n=1 Tax=Candidatus Kinetoplastidibacterium stringomonadis TCC290E TaxID=1208920 RepID=M1LX81_9PROT|nr:diaminopimelate decarboxylase [Candidatus Kinetoplastibacterium oncopeltii]AGF48676.1 diaminopimelate decarboxylase [Candidatus Kinetoplastibacterium oncopeltii TCC290E]